MLAVPSPHPGLAVSEFICWSGMTTDSKQSVFNPFGPETLSWGGRIKHRIMCNFFQSILN